MKSSPSSEANQSSAPQPAAYDQYGRPLYVHPPQNPSGSTVIADKPTMISNPPNDYPGENFDPRTRRQYAVEPDLVHVARAVEPDEREISAELQQLHDESVSRYPFLNLSRGEHVIVAVRRHPIGLLIPVVVSGFVIVMMLTLLFSYPLLIENGALAGLPPFGVVVIPALLLIALMGLGGFVAIWVYLQNKFFMTNESVIQEIQTSLFARHEQTVSLGSIEDASFLQAGIIQMLFDYGTIRLSTEGEETTYRFHYVANPKRQIAILNNAIEAFKNGRPVTSETVGQLSAGK